MIFWKHVEENPLQWPKVEGQMWRSQGQTTY